MSDDTAYSTWELIFGAGPLIQGVMGILLVASVASWAVIYVKARQLVAANRSEAAFRDIYARAQSLDLLLRNLGQEDTAARSGSASILRTGHRQVRRLLDEGLSLAEARESSHRAMRVAVSRHVDRLDRNLVYLAVVASAAPFVGLFGTVWGIMNSFQNIGAMGQATLAVVAPGIAEALIATALGLGAAIPAVVAYNIFTRHVESHHTRLENFAEELLSVFERQARA